ncbi:MAG: TrmO family methyltransferase domain-containing protein [Anaerolineae bacterium]
MDLHIRPYEERDLAPILELSLLAWEPIFTAWEQILGPDLYPLAIYRDWRESQQEVVETHIHKEEIVTWVAEVDDRIVGFVAYQLYEDTKTGEVQLLAVHPDDQNRGIGIFATRSPFRPNPISLTTCPILAIDAAEGRITVVDIDAFDGTPIVDLKAYLPICDRVRDVRVPPWFEKWPEWLPETGMPLEDAKT